MTGDGCAIIAAPLGAALADTLIAFRPHRIFTHPEPPPHADPAIPVRLAAQDQDCALPPAALWPADLRRARLRLRRIDTLYAGQDVALIWLAVPHAAAILAGAEQTLRRRRPAIVIDPRAAPDAETLRTALPGYTATLRRGLWCFTAAGAAPFVLPRAAARSPITVPIDDALPAPGLHPSEPGAEAGGRWTGAAIETSLLLAHPPQGAWRLALDIADWGNAQGGFDAGIGFVRLAPARIGPAEIDYPPVTLGADALVLRVALYPPRPIPDQVRWPRKIGVRLRAVRLLPAR